jgi:hypothetical protein
MARALALMVVDDEKVLRRHDSLLITPTNPFRDTLDHRLHLHAKTNVLSVPPDDTLRNSTTTIPRPPWSRVNCLSVDNARHHRIAEMRTTA